MKRAPQFELIAGSVPLDFANTLDDRFTDQPKELLGSYRDLLVFAEECGVFSKAESEHLAAKSLQNKDAAQRALKNAIRMREAMFEVFWAIVQKKPVPLSALAVLNEYVQEASQHSILAPSKGRFEWQFDSATNSLDAPLWPIARSAADLLASDQLEFVRVCASKTCDWFFLDESKNHRRRWCDMTKCGNRAKVQRFYSRKKKEEAQ